MEGGVPDLDAEAIPWVPTTRVAVVLEGYDAREYAAITLSTGQNVVVLVRLIKSCVMGSVHHGVLGTRQPDGRVRLNMSKPVCTLATCCDARPAGLA